MDGNFILLALAPDECGQFAGDAACKRMSGPLYRPGPKSATYLKFLFNRGKVGLDGMLPSFAKDFCGSMLFTLSNLLYIFLNRFI